MLKYIKRLCPINTVTIYTDGACSGNPGPGGWGVVILYEGEQLELSGHIDHSTNNQMELTAAIKALETIIPGCNVQLYTDSKYVIDGITSWIKGWKKRDWKNAQNKPVLNKDLWEQLDSLNAQHTIQWNWVKGHNGNKYNERADMLAQRASTLTS